MHPAPSNSVLSWPRHLIQIEGMAASDIQTILDTADGYVARNRAVNKKHKILSGRTLINLFFENSTRTRTSFELAGKRLSMDVINISASTSSTNKGETLLDTAMTLNAMQADAIVLRHAHAGAVQLIAQKVTAHVINAGDGAHEHPTQALLDALTIRQKKGRIEGLNVTICGDIAHSRVARSNIHLLKTLGANVTLVAPPTLMPKGVEKFGTHFTSDMREGLKDADVVMTLRIQQERMAGRGLASVQEYFHFWGLDYEKLAYAKPDAIVLDPGPFIRGLQISSDLADDLAKTAILTQVENGVAVRQAVLELLLGGK